MKYRSSDGERQLASVCAVSAAVAADVARALFAAIVADWSRRSLRASQVDVVRELRKRHERAHAANLQQTQPQHQVSELQKTK
mgnify:CR=1 FL=1